MKEKDLKKAEYWVNRVKAHFVPKIDPEKMIEMQLKIEGAETEPTFCAPRLNSTVRVEWNQD